jgi:hypothetical protein
MKSFAKILVTSLLSFLKTNNPDYFYDGAYYTYPQGPSSEIVRIMGYDSENTTLFHYQIHVASGTVTPLFEKEPITTAPILEFLTRNAPGLIARARREASMNTKNTGYPSNKAYKTMMGADEKVKTEGGGRLKKAKKGTRKARGSARNSSRAGRK